MFSFVSPGAGRGTDGWLGQPGVGWKVDWQVDCSRSCLPAFPTAVHSYYVQNEVVTTDDLDFRHHNYKDMRQVGCLS